MKSTLLMIVTVFALTGCLKTAEQVRREQRMENMSQQLSDSQNIVADLTVMLKNLQGQIDTLNGKVEELQRSQDELKGADLKGMTESMNVMKQQLNTIQETQAAQGEEQKQQRGFIEKVTDKLGKLGTSNSSSKKNAKDELAEARKLVSRKKWGEARNMLEGLMGDSSLSAADLNKAYHAMGEVEFGQKNWEKSLVYFSKIYTKYPKSSLAPSSLLHIGKALDNLGKKEEAKQAFQELKANYPGTSAAKEVR